MPARSNEVLCAQTCSRTPEGTRSPPTSQHTNVQVDPEGMYRAGSRAARLIQPWSVSVVFSAPWSLVWPSHLAVSESVTAGDAGSTESGTVRKYIRTVAVRENRMERCLGAFRWAELSMKTGSPAPIILVFRRRTTDSAWCPLISRAL